jgi:hypothetical protein
MFKIVSKGHGIENYSIQLPILLSPIAKFSLSENKDNCYFTLENHKIFVSIENDFYIFKSFDFGTEDEAQKFILKLCASLRLFSLRNKIGIRFDYEPASIIDSPKIYMPKGWTEAVDSKWKLDDEGYLLDGIINSFSTFIIPEHKKIVDDGAISFTPVSLHQLSKISEYYFEISAHLNFDQVFGNAELDLAFQVFSTAYFHHIPLLTFTNLVTCLELLSETKESNSFTLDLINEVQSLLKNKAKEQTEEHKKNDIHKLRSKIGKHKYESITESVFRLVYEYHKKYGQIDKSLILSNEQEYLTAVTEIYAIRSDLVHSGDVKDKKEHQPNQRFWDAFHQLENITQNVLYNKLIDQYFVKQAG